MTDEQEAVDRAVAPMLFGLPVGVSRQEYNQAVKAAVIYRGWQPGTALENLVSLILARFGIEKPEQQYKAGRYRLDYAWPGRLIALEADGWWHRSPEGAAKDRLRDSWLRSQGWVVFRVDDEHGEHLLADQLVRVARFVRCEDQDWAKSWSGTRQRRT